MRFSDLRMKDPPEILWHYTSAAGLSGILSSSELWLTHIAMQNDHMEQKEAIERLGKSLSSRYPDSGQDFSVISYFGRARVCTLSFSEADDLLSQWRGYGNSGQGFAIGFASSELKKLAEQNDCDLLPCVYNEAEKNDLISELVAGNPIGNGPGLNLFEASRIAAELHPISSIIKSEKFQEEKEWRLFKYRKVDTSQDSYCIIPGQHPRTVWKIDFGKINTPKLVRKILIGPCNDPELERTRVTEMLLASGFRAVSFDTHIIDVSSIPLRKNGAAT